MVHQEQTELVVQAELQVHQVRVVQAVLQVHQEHRVQVELAVHQVQMVQVVLQSQMFGIGHYHWEVLKFIVVIVI